jgi:acyl dehydratase
MDMPGPGTVFLSQDWKFTAPVFIGDTITATVVVLSVHASKPVVQLGIEIERQNGEVVLGAGSRVRDESITVPDMAFLVSGVRGKVAGAWR